LHIPLVFLYIWTKKHDSLYCRQHFFVQEEATIVDTTLWRIGIRALQLGGAVLKNHYGRVGRVMHKETLELVTDVDHLSEETVVHFLSQQCPEHGILTEERAELASRSNCRWILDPLDGTTNYTHGYPFFCVSLAFEKEGIVLWGGVYDPLRDELFTAQHGQGARLNDLAVKVSQTRDMGSALLCTGFPYDVHESAENNIDNFVGFLKKARAVRRDGAAALDLCYVACGRFDGFWEMKLKAWDIAAGGLIVQEAGGRVTGFDGTAWTPGRHDILASNGGMHEAMLDMLTVKEQP
jgi:myo-inositol-1(or 4)-monophosphatase